MASMYNRRAQLDDAGSHDTSNNNVGRSSSDAHAILSSLAPRLMTSRILRSPAFALGPSNASSSSSQALTTSLDSTSSTLQSIARARLMLPKRMGGLESTSAAEAAVTDHVRISELLKLDSSTTTSWGSRTITDGQSLQVPLWLGFEATVPSAHNSKQQRRKKRAGIGQQVLGLEDGRRLGLKQRVDEARGLLTFDDDDETEREGGVGRRTLQQNRKNRKTRRQLGTKDVTVTQTSTVEELELELEDISLDRRHVATRRSVLTGDRDAIDAQISKLQLIRSDLERSLLTLKEDDLELVDEEEGVRERLETKKRDGTTSTSRLAPSSSRRRRGPAFLPTEHDDLPSNIAFMTISGHSEPLTSLDFTEPYGTLVTASLDETVRLWDLTTGDEVGRLRGHDGVVKCLQVEGSVGITGGADGKVRMWDLDKAEDDAGSDAGLDGETTSCVTKLEGHTQAVTALYFDSSCLVTGSSDKTLRQWDLSTGQAVLTMDILWAMQNPAASLSLSASPPLSPTLLAAADASDPFASEFAATPTKRRSKMPGSVQRTMSASMYSPSLYPVVDASSSLESYADFVGGVQFWGYALASASGDGCVRMWDMRTGQAHRTLVGHTGPVTCLQFDEWHLVSGSVDKSIRVWDLRTGSIADTMRHDQAVTAVQFDSRKIIAAAGDAAVRVFNRTTLQHTLVTLNGHTAPVERLRYVDRYMVTGGRDCLVKVWSL